MYACVWYSLATVMDMVKHWTWYYQHQYNYGQCCQSSLRQVEPRVILV